MIVLAELDVDGSARLAAAIARVRALEARMGFGCGAVVMMAAGDTPEQKRAAWRARARRRRDRKKGGLERIVVENVPHDSFIGMMLDLGVYVRPAGRVPSFKAAFKAFEERLRNAAPYMSRVTVRPLIVPVSGEMVGSNQEPAFEHVKSKD